MIPIRLIGLILIIIGILIITISSIYYLGGKSSGIILIGPFPIIWGLNLDKKWLKVLIAIQIIIIIIILVFIILSLGILW